MTIEPYWRHIGQWILGITLGRQMTLSVLQTFGNNWMIIIVMLLLSIVFSLLSGLFLWRYSESDLLTSLFGTAPGGVSAMPSIAEEIGANIVVVSIVQMIRLFLVVGIIPLMASYWGRETSVFSMALETGTSLGALLWTFVLAFAAWGGYYLGKRLKLPAPWLVGGMMGVAGMEMLGSFLSGEKLVPWWPHWLITLAQIFIGASIGSKLNKEMFEGAKRIVFVGLLSSGGLMVVMLLCSIGVSQVTGIPLVTAILSFAPGGVAEMATASLSLHANAAFVVAVQSLRLLTIFILLPPLFRLLRGSLTKREFRTPKGFLKKKGRFP